jgi:hypothetical protein
MRFFLAFLLSFFVLAANPCPAQDDDEDKKKDEDFSELEMDENWDMDFWSRTNTIDFERPTISIMGGQTQPIYHDDVFTGDFFQPKMMEVKIGYSDFIATHEDERIVEYEFSYIYLSNISNDIMAEDVADNEMEVSAWRFGFGSADGYGWALGENASIVLYHADDMAWTKLDFKDEAQNSDEQDAVEVFGDAFRFGEQFESGIKIRPFEYVSIDAGYQRMIVFPRHMFWYWTLSTIIEGTAHGLANEFNEEILESSPIVAPVVAFVLKGAISYGMYELRSSKMNWPVKTAPPMMFDNYKVGISFTF